jgi:hypothetical protein
MKKRETITRYLGPVTVLKWCDKRSVTMVSVYHSADMQRVSKKGKEMQKPLYVTNNNCNFWEVNLKDQLLHMYVVKRKMVAK